MCKLLFILLLNFAIVQMAQGQKLSRDSMRYYQRELETLWKNNYDSVKNSAKYKEIVSKLHRNSSKKVTVELLANIGMYFTDFKNLNARLKSIGEQEIKAAVPSVGASLAIGYPILTYGFEASGYAFSNSTAKFRGLHLRYYLATNVFKKSRIALHPQIGYTLSFLNMFVYKSPGQTNFNDLFLIQANNIQLDHATNYLDLALGFKLKSHNNDPSYWQFLRVGYRYGLKDVAWSIKDGDLQNAPTDRNNQLYFQFCIGLDN